MSRVRSARRRQQQMVRRPGKLLAVPPATPTSRGALFRSAAGWPLYECLLSRNWQQAGEIVQALVARRSPSGMIAAGAFLVDLGCLGVKDGFAQLFDSEREYRQQLRKRIEQSQEMEEADLNLVAKVIQEAVAYAQELGFPPHPDSRRAMGLLAGTDPDSCDVPIPLGDGTGKPLFIAGPHDNIPAVMAKLERAVGRDGFRYLVPMGGDAKLLPDDEGD